MGSPKDHKFSEVKINTMDLAKLRMLAGHIYLAELVIEGQLRVEVLEHVSGGDSRWRDLQNGPASEFGALLQEAGKKLALDYREEKLAEIREFVPDFTVSAAETLFCPF